MPRNTINRLTTCMLLVLLAGCASIGRSLKQTLTGNQERARVVIQPTEWIRGHVATWQRMPEVVSIDGLPALSFGRGYGRYDVFPRTHTFVVAVEWSNHWQDQTNLTFEAQAGKQYLLLTYELAPGESEEKAEVRRRTIIEKAGVGTAVWRLVEQSGTSRPFERCCFVWIQEEENGNVVAGERPKDQMEWPLGRQSLNRYALSFSLAVLCNGCIMYVPEALHLSARESKAETFLPAIIPGQTTKEEVYRMLGEPDGYSWNRNQLVYRWKKLKFFLFLPFGYTDAGVVTARRKYQLLIILDERGVVVEKKLEADLDWKQGISGLWSKEE